MDKPDLRDLAQYRNGFSRVSRLQQVGLAAAARIFKSIKFSKYSDDGGL